MKKQQLTLQNKKNILQFTKKLLFFVVTIVTSPYRIALPRSSQHLAMTSEVNTIWHKPEHQIMPRDDLKRYSFSGNNHLIWLVLILWLYKS
ncbi:hypothetical protein SAMN04488130_10592 [Flavobacterium urumqiense]|uniref:Uncharacterized protein n=1 Tax=Flavobacterium urumqiense TaxID=935224 RepID=A0A1H5WXQ3_9FLAO|nr:hypothetical protein SAMN04488130_10592 [Flavobacterium urumqiense]